MEEILELCKRKYGERLSKIVLVAEFLVICATSSVIGILVLALLVPLAD